MASLQKEILNRQISALQEEVKTLQAQWESTLEDLQKLKLARQLEQKFKIIGLTQML